MSIDETSWEEALRVLRAPGRVVLACHLGPDGDALGSMLALGLALRAAGREVIASWGSDPFVVPKQYGFLPGLDLATTPDRVPPAPDLMATFDAGSFARLGTLEPNARAARSLVVVDHHASNDSFGTVNLIDPDAAASAVLVYELLGRLGAPLDRDIAACLYTGIVTDTGRFQYRNTTPRIHEIAADLLSYDIAHDTIARLVYDTHPVGYLKVVAAALDRAEVIPDAGMIWTWITQADLAAAGIDLEDTEALIDVVRTAETAEVACVLKENPQGRFKVSMRSKGAVDVGAVCEAFGGGGHRLAAGFTSADGDPRGIVEAIAARLPA
jgi:phosphoesterase RecJ-like protein